MIYNEPTEKSLAESVLPKQQFTIVKDDVAEEVLAAEIYPAKGDCSHILLRGAYLSMVYPYMSARYKGWRVPMGQADFHQQTKQLYKECKAKK